MTRLWPLLLLACGGSAEPDDPPAPEPVEEPAPVPTPAAPAPATAPAPAPPTGDPVPVELRFYGVGGLHRVYFSEDPFVDALGAALGACLTETAQVLVSYDTERFVGKIVLKVPPDALECLPRKTDGGWDLSPLVPVSTALADYRDAVAGGRDFRLSSFRIGLDFTRGPRACTLWAAGQHPPDGTEFSPCVDLNGVSSCSDRDADAGVTTWTPRDAEARGFASACFAR